MPLALLKPPIEIAASLSNIRSRAFTTLILKYFKNNLHQIFKMVLKARNSITACRYREA